MRLGMLTQWYDPEPGPAALPGVLARELARRGHEVYVLTGFPNYPSGRIAEGYSQSLRQREERDGVHVIRVPLYASHDASGLKRIANYASFGASAATIGALSLPPLDALWVNYSPITVASAMWSVQLMRGTPTVCEVGDLWPDTMLVAGLTGSSGLVRRGGAVLNRWVNAMYATSDAVVAIAPGVLPILRERGVSERKLHYIPKPADETIFKPGGTSLRPRFGLGEDDVVVTYAGAMGAAQGLADVVRATVRVEELGFKLLMAGSGTAEPELRALAADNPKVVFAGRLAQSEMTDFLATGDLALVSLASHPSSQYTMPSKTQSTLAAGRGLLGAVEGDAARLIESRGVGLVAQPGDPASIAMAMNKAVALGRPGLAAMGVRAREVYEEEFSVTLTTDRAEELLERIARRRRGVKRLVPGDGPRPTGASIDNVLRRDEIRAVAELHRRAFPTFFLTSLGRPFLEVFYRSFLDYSDGIIVVARDEAGVPVGIGVGTLDPNGFYRRSLRKHLFGYFSASAQAALRNPRVATRLLGAFVKGGDGVEHEDGALFSSLCVAPETAGQGIGRKLLEAFTDEAGRLGAERVFLTTDADDNDRVNAIYVKGGWRLFDSFVTKQGRRMNRYVYDIAPGATAL